MLTEEQYDSIFREFVTSGGNNVESLYSVLPYINGTQQSILLRLMFIAQKYDFKELNIMLNNYIKLQKENRSLGFNFGQYLKSVSLYEQLKGFKLTAGGGNNNE